MGIMQEEITWASCFIFSSGVGRGSALLQLVCLSSVEGILCIGFFGLCPNMTSVSSSSGGWDCKRIHSESVSATRARAAAVGTKQADRSAISDREQPRAALGKAHGAACSPLQRRNAVGAGDRYLTVWGAEQRLHGAVQDALPLGRGTRPVFARCCLQCTPAYHRRDTGARFCIRSLWSTAVCC